VSPASDLLERLKRFEGKPLGRRHVARDPVNQAMIRHWCDAMGDTNPNYTDPERAARSPHGGIVAPPTMLQAWTMPGLAPRPAEVRAGSHGELFGLLDEAGFTSVVATNCEQEYVRYLRPGDLLSVESSIESISEEKKTGLGAGHFVTQLHTYRDQTGALVATMRFRMLKYRPPERGEGAQQGESKPAQPARSRGEAQPRRSADEEASVGRAAGRSPAQAKGGRPRPGITHDNAFFWEGVKAGKLLIQRCAACGRLRHPPGPMCPGCQSLEWSAREASGRGTVYSFVVAHDPPVPPFQYPHAIALVELEEGTRLVANLVGIDPKAVRIGLPVRVEFAEVEEGLVLPQFRPVAGAA